MPFPGVPAYSACRTAGRPCRQTIRQIATAGRIGWVRADRQGRMRTDGCWLKRAIGRIVQLGRAGGSGGWVLTDCRNGLIGLRAEAEGC